MLCTVQCRPAAACARKSPPRVHSKETRQDKTTNPRALIGGKPPIVPVSFDSLFRPCPVGRASEETQKQRIQLAETMPPPTTGAGTVACGGRPPKQSTKTPSSHAPEPDGELKWSCGRRPCRPPPGVCAGDPAHRSKMCRTSTALAVATQTTGTSRGTSLWRRPPGTSDRKT